MVKLYQSEQQIDRTTTREEKSFLLHFSPERNMKHEQGGALEAEAQVGPSAGE